LTSRKRSVGAWHLADSRRATAGSRFRPVCDTQKHEQVAAKLSLALASRDRLREVKQAVHAHALQVVQCCGDRLWLRWDFQNPRTL
jgi:hypothetical protein